MMHSGLVHGYILSDDVVNRLIAETFPGETCGTRRYDYDAVGRLISRIDQSGITTRYAYDAAGRLRTRQYASGAADRFRYDAAGRLTAAESGRYGNAVQRRYDRAGQLSQEALVIDGITLPIRYQYDELGRVAQLVHPDGIIDARRFDERGLLAGVSLAGRALSRREYDVAGRLVAHHLGNGLTETRKYVPGAHLVANIQVPGVTDFSYQYDSNGRKTREIDGIDAAWTQAFAYDASGRLTQWSRPDRVLPNQRMIDWFEQRSGRRSDFMVEMLTRIGQNIAAWQDGLPVEQHWNLSPVGDWTSTEINGRTQSRGHTPVHELVRIGHRPLHYDAKGNLI